MSRNVLLMHHMESMWEESLRQYDTSLEECVSNTIDYILFSDQEIDEVIVTRFEGIDWDDEHAPLIDVCERLGIPIKLEEYAYGFTRDIDEDGLEMYPDENLDQTWCFGDRDHHNESNILEIHPWHHELKNDHVILGGAFEGECLNDMEKILGTLQINVTKVDSLCIGTGVSYEPLAKTKLVDEMSHHQQALDTLSDEIEKHLDKLEIDDLLELAKSYPKLADKHVDRYHDIMEEYKDEVESKYAIDSPYILLDYAPSTPYVELSEVFEASFDGDISELETVINENMMPDELEEDASFSP